MWRFWHRLFGWHYVAITFGGIDIICRVERMPNGDWLVVLMDEFYAPQGDFERVISVNSGKSRACRPLTWQRSAGRAA